MINFEKNLNKAENLFFQYIIKNIKNKKYILKLKNKDILKIIYPHEKDKIILNFLQKFNSKSIIYKYKNLSNEILECHFHIISNLKIVNSTYYLTIHQNLIEIFQSNNLELKQQNYDIFLSLSNEINRKFISILIYKKTINSYLIISLEELKKLLNIENSYPRFYDFNKNILLPFIKDLKENSNITIKYEVIKKNKYENSKILGLKFDIKSILNISYLKNIELLFSKIKSFTNDKVDDIIYEFIDKYGYEYVKNNFEYSVLHYKTKFITFFIFSLKYDYYKNLLNSKIKKYSNYTLISQVSKIFLNKNQLRKALINEIESKKLSYFSEILIFFEETTIDYKNIKYGMIYEKLYIDFEKENYIELNVEDYIIVIEFNGKLIKSNILIFKKIL